MKNKKYAYLIAFFMITFQNINAQAQLSLTPGAFYNGNFSSDDLNGFGAILGLEYRIRPEHFFSIELRTKYGYYSFDDGTKWREDSYGQLQPPQNKGEARVDYSLFCPQIGLVPKFYLPIIENLSLFLENEFSIGLITGKFRYKGVPDKVHFTESIFNYNVGLGAEYKLEKCTLAGSLGYSTLNFRSKIRKHQPANYQGSIPNQDAVIWINLLVKVPLL